MAKILDAFPETTRESKYPWDEWLDGKIRELVQGEDFKTKVETFRQTCAKAATKKGLAVRTASRKNEKNQPCIVLQAQAPGKPGRKKA